jgi:hypothetical protein
MPVTPPGGLSGTGGTNVGTGRGPSGIPGAAGLGASGTGSPGFGTGGPSGDAAVNTPPGAAPNVNAPSGTIIIERF